MTTRRLGKSEIVVRDGIRVTAPALSIIDVAEARTAPEQIVAAVGQALDRGIVAESKILGVAKTRGVEVESRALVDGFSRSDSTGEVRSGAAFRQALEQRLLARSRDSGTSLFRLRKAVAFDTLLAFSGPRRLRGPQASAIREP